MANLIIFRNAYDTYEALENVLNYVDNCIRTSYIGGQNILLGNPIEQAMALTDFSVRKQKERLFTLQSLLMIMTL